MRIAFVSYEYPPDTADGGIATYVRQAAHMLRDRGHTIEVFAASRESTGLTWDGTEIPIYRVRVAEKQQFAGAIAPIFAERHNRARFDVLEGPDFNADATYCRCASPGLPLVLRLHTPRYLATALNAFSAAPAVAEHGAARDWSTHIHPLPGYDFSTDPEYLHAMEADLITAPSHAIRDIVCRDWQIDPNAVDVVANVFQPAAAFLAIPPDARCDSKTQVVTFVGRLEGRKGVLSLAAAIPEVLRRFPDVEFRFVGRPLTSPEPGIDMLAYLKRLLDVHSANVRFVGQVLPESIPAILSDADICVFPSRWENFPCVCLEAMSAARGIVGSMAGGMAEMLRDDTGLLVPPDSPVDLAQAVVELLENPAERIEMGRRARQRVESRYGVQCIGPKHEATYYRAIANRAATKRG